MTREAIFKQYAQALGAAAAAGDAREESSYPALRDLLKQVADATGRSHIHVTVQPAPTDAGNPDFRLWNGTDAIVGYVEAKKPAQTDLAGIADTAQLRRYRDTFPNLLLTNFTEFRLYRNGQHIQTVPAASPSILTDLRAAPVIERPDELWALLEQFLDYSVPQAATAEALAVQLAKRTRFLRATIQQQVAQRNHTGGARLAGFYEAFRQFLIADLTHEQFADLYAQTITYGLFAARTRSTNTFTRRAAFDRIPQTIGILRDVFRFISLEELPPQLEWIVDDIAEVLARADASGILDQYYREHKGADPIVHFYETFLAQYNPEERERRGVYYTPEPVVSYIVRSLHSILTSDFGLSDGLASDGVTLLDPAAGTMTFVAHAAQLAVSEFVNKHGAGAREDFIRERVLRNFYAFELMMAPYAVGHLKMAFFLEELGHRLADDERVKFYLTNTLDMEELAQSEMPFYRSLSQESRAASRVKKQQPILVILGNPPYSGHSANLSERPVRIARGNPYIVGWKPSDPGGASPVQRVARRELEDVLQPTFIGRLVRDYFFVDSRPLGEKNPKWLQDDYVKFLRFAQWKIEQAGRGVVGMITNHAWLDNPTFRGMRQTLMRTFDDIYVLDLHGNALKRETCPDGSPDKNVFDIRQGVAIALFVKRGGRKKEPASVRHAELWGTRARKFHWLSEHDRSCTTWRELLPRSPSYLFVPRDDRRQAAFRSFPSLPGLLPINSVGIVTARDHLTIHWTPADAWRTVTVFSRMDPEIARKGYRLGRDARDWKVALAQKDLLDSGPHRQNVVTILYRPFDTRHTYYTGRSRGFLCMPRPEVMREMLQDNLAIVAPKRVEHVGPWQHALVSSCATDHVAVSLKTIDYVFPLFCYPNGERDLFEAMEVSARSPNLHPKLLDILKAAHCRQPTPEQVFHYVYAVLYAPQYRDKYAEFLRSDFPRVPFTRDAALFAKVARLGERLTGLHLLRSEEVDEGSVRFEGLGDGKVAKGTKAGVRYDPGEKRVYINQTQYFAPVPQEVWEYRVGGYQVCEKWLKDRQERRLELEDSLTYCRIVTALGLTIKIQQALDELYPAIEESLLPIELGP
ncbi:MAG: DNA methyltransferase [Planctomycetes bacterium]|nr:DNA methyltransferase [Planctomycetota bacterium]